MNHEEWKQYRCPRWDMSCINCLSAECLNDPEYEPDDASTGTMQIQQRL